MKYGLDEMMGKRFGRLVVVGPFPSSPVTQKWVCRCDCGARYVAKGTRLRAGLTKSCGCARFATGSSKTKKKARRTV